MARKRGKKDATRFHERTIKGVTHFRLDDEWLFTAIPEGRHKLKIKHALIAAVVVLVAAGCSANPGLSVSDGAVAPADSGRDPFRFPTRGDAPADDAMYPLAAIFGTVMLDPATGCIIIGTETTASQVLWPHGYTAQWDGEQVQIRNSDGEVVTRTGEQIEAGGGVIPPELLPTDNPCLTSGSVFGLNPLDMNS